MNVGGIAVFVGDPAGTVGVGVGLKKSVGVAEGDGVMVDVGIDVGVCVSVAVNEGVTVGLYVAVEVDVGDAVGEKV